MARPKKERELPATCKIERAFWDLLASTEYSKITVKKLSDTAGINRNAFYYHYDNIDDVAQKAFSTFTNSTIVEQFIRMMLSQSITMPETITTEIFTESVRKLQLCASSRAVYLNDLLKKEIQNVWFRIAKIDAAALKQNERLSIEFALSGIIGLLSNPDVQKDPFLMLRFSETRLGKAVLTMMAELGEIG